MKNEKKWFLIAVCIIVVCLGTTAGLNYVIDPYGIFRQDFSWQFIEPNKNFIKGRYVSQNPDRYDCFLFASSRGNNIDAAKIKRGNCYNMQYSAGLPGEHLNMMKYMVSKGVRIKYAVIALDEFSFQYSPREHLSQPMRHPYPPALNEPLFPYYMRYLFFWYDWDIMKTCLKGFVNKLSGDSNGIFVKHDVFGTGRTISDAEDAAIERNPVSHANRQEFKKRFQPSGVYIDGAIRDLKEMIRFAAEKKIMLEFLIVPFYATKYLDVGPYELDTFRRKLAKLAGFWDFSGFNSITVNTYYYYEAWHFRNIVGDMMMARMYGGHNASVPPDFGIYVNSGNIEEHLSDLRQEMNTYLNQNSRTTGFEKPHS